MEYDPEEFIVPSGDDRGHSIREYIRCPPGWERDMEIIIECRKFPYQTKSDLIRHAILRHLAWLHRIAEDMPKSYFSSLMVQRRVMQEHKFQADTEQTFKALGDMIELYVSRSDFKQARKMVSSCLDSLRSVAECGWKTRFQSRFTNQYGYLIDSSVELPRDATDPDPIIVDDIGRQPSLSIAAQGMTSPVTAVFLDRDEEGRMVETPVPVLVMSGPISRVDTNEYLFMHDPDPVQISFFSDSPSPGVGVLVFVDEED